MYIFWYISLPNTTVGYGNKCMYLSTTHSLWKFGEDATLQTWIVVNYMKNTQKTTGKPIKWIICFSPMLSKVFLQKSFTENHEISCKFKKICSWSCGL